MIVSPLYEVAMQTVKESPRYHVVSLRVSNEELDEIMTLVSIEHTTVSELMRDALKVIRGRVGEGRGAARLEGASRSRH